MINIATLTSKNKIRIVRFSFFLIPLLIDCCYLWAFYPGILSFDSVNQWAQLSEFDFSNWHPAYHTILMWIITRLWYSPAAIAFFQIFVFSMVIAYGLSAFREEFDIPYVLLILVAVTIAAIPFNGMMVTTLWKDVLYSIFVLLLTIYILKIIHTRGSWMSLGHNWIYFGLTVANISLLRHNGFPVAFGSLVICMFFFEYRKHFFKALVISLFFIVVVTGPIYKAFKVDPSSSQPAGVIFVHPIAAQVHAGVDLTEGEKNFLNKIFPLKNGWPYSCYDATILFYQGVNFQPVQKHPLYLAKTFLTLTLVNPRTTVNHFVCLSSFVWQIKQPKDVYLETILISNLDVGAYPDWQPFQVMVAQNSRLPTMRQLIVKTIDSLLLLDPDRIFWRPAIYLYVFALAVFIFVFRGAHRLYFILLVPVLLQSLIIGLTAQLQAMRYQYPVYIVSILFSVPLFYLAIISTKSLRIKEMKTSISEADRV